MASYWSWPEGGQLSVALCSQSWLWRVDTIGYPVDIVPCRCTLVGVRPSLMSGLIVLVGSVTCGRVALVTMVATPPALWGIDLDHLQPIVAFEVPGISQ